MCSHRKLGITGKAESPPFFPKPDAITMKLTVQRLRVYPGRISTGKIYNILEKWGMIPIAVLPMFSVVWLFKQDWLAGLILATTVAVSLVGTCGKC